MAEGWIYFILALVELCSVIPSLSKDNINLFRSFDIGIGIYSLLLLSNRLEIDNWSGIISFLPLGLYTLYLYLFTRRKLLVNLPKYVTKVAKVSMFLALPLVIATNEVASISRITISESPVLLFLTQPVSNSQPSILRGESPFSLFPINI